MDLWSVKALHCDLSTESQSVLALEHYDNHSSHRLSPGNALFFLHVVFLMQTLTKEALT